MSGDATAFSRNYRDLSRQQGTDAGFQFEFSCRRCRDTWRSPFEPYTSGRAAGWLQRGSGLAGRLLGSGNSYSLSRAADGLAGAGWGQARDEAFQRAVTEVQRHFHRCARCTDAVCGRCWNVEAGMCLRCVPDTAAEVQAARHRGLNREATRRAEEVGEARAAGYDVDTPRQLVCPSCSTETRGGAFCHGCGHRLAQAAQCGSCRADLPAGAGFCPGCGSRAG
ncbi:zinc ribbon domain-containing protein [Streptomyces durbertensis]|uniref:Zinc ribbon domain-containing protein n=1 Tax=Streptomyces durbertensis TaxID=2448886 RepID=A0ABR6EMA0_9ACTN|nr:zinc ribbon domain-containing protein [Streptomyces durbertensis]MBB1246238.1 zinc ribbon domain-containing protein [Streptomyces durbertensis]